MKAFVIGGSGYIGKPLLKALGKQLEAYGTSSTGVDNLILLSLSEPDKFNFNPISKGDVVFVTAAISAPDICSRKYDYAWSINVDGTSHFISRVLKKGGRVVFFSSDTVYGEAEDTFDESACCIPVGDYARMKHEVELKFADDPLFKTVRLSYVFSKHDKFTDYLFGCTKNKKIAEIFHPFYRAVVHRDDVIEGVIGLALHWDRYPQAVINMGGPEIISRIQFSQELQAGAFPGLRIQQVEPETGFFSSRPKVIAMNSPLLDSILGTPPLTLKEAIRIEFDVKGRH